MTRRPPRSRTTPKGTKPAGPKARPVQDQQRRQLHQHWQKDGGGQRPAPSHGQRTGHRGNR